MGKKSSKRQSRRGVMHLDAETGLAPVPPLGVVAAKEVLSAKSSRMSTVRRWAPGKPCAGDPSP